MSFRYLARVGALAALLIASAGAWACAHRQSYGDYASGTACGVERWSVKTLMDAAAPALPTTPRFTTVASLDQMTEPAGADGNPQRVGRVEHTLWELDAQLVGYKQEKDSDVHLILRDARTGATMVAEIPYPGTATLPGCVSGYALRRWGPDFERARETVAQIGGHEPSRRWWWLDYRGATPPTVRITGYGFWDFEHAQDGASPNHVEIHPVIDIHELSQ